MRDISLEELLEAGCHFGHQVNRRNPKADEFIFEARVNVNIINLEKTREGLLTAGNFIKDLSAKGGYILFVGTKRQAQAIVKEEMQRALRLTSLAQGDLSSDRILQKKGLFYVVSRWIGGTFTNYGEVAKNYKKLKDLEEFLASEKTHDYTKREVLLFERQKNHLKDLYEGVVNMDRIPEAVYIIDTHHEDTAVGEASKMGVSILGIVDTNSDPTVIDYPIPANDDAVGSIKLITSYLVDAWIEGQEKARKKDASEAKKESKEGKKKNK